MAAKNDTLRRPVQVRSERYSSYDVDDFAPAQPRDQEWKNTPLDRARRLMGEADGGRYDFRLDGEGVSADWIPRDAPEVGATGLKPEDVLSAGAWSRFGEALLLDVPAGAQLSAPVVLHRDAFGATARAAHTIIRVGAGASVFLQLDHAGDATLAENTEILVGEGATATVVSIEDWAPTAAHGGAVFMSLDRDATLKHVQVSLGGDFIRINPTAVFRAPGGNLTLDGIYFADSGQHIEHQVYVDHAVPDCYSRVTYKGALQGEGARTVWIGDALIRANADNTDTYELNRNLVLTRGARADSVPNLEIETGNIVGAGHASATGRFDEQQLFYLQARGIPESVARKLVVHGFLMDTVHRIGNEPIETRLDEAITAELEAVDLS
jgi:Fe-S cluster assembly protein SufD